MGINYFNEGFTDNSYLNICKQMVLGIYKDRTGQDINFYYSDEDEVNAWADLDKDENDLLVINAKTVVEFFAIMKTAFSQKEIFPEIGDISNETNSFIEGVFTYFDKQIRYSNTPHDVIRDTMANYAALFSIRFIFTHELGHIMSGHTRYLGTTYMNSKIGMRLERVVNHSRYCLDRRTMEMDADASAITSSFDNVAMLYKYHYEDAPISLLKRREEIFSIWSFSIAAIFMLFETDSVSDYSHKGYYLPNEARFMMVMNAAYETAKSYINHNIAPELGTNKLEIMRSVVYGVKQCESFFQNVYCKSFFWSNAILNPDERYKYYSSEVLQNWDNKLKDKLVKYSRAPLYDKDKIDEMIEIIKKSQIV